MASSITAFGLLHLVLEKFPHTVPMVSATRAAITKRVCHHVRQGVPTVEDLDRLLPALVRLGFALELPRDDRSARFVFRHPGLAELSVIRPALFLSYSEEVNRAGIRHNTPLALELLSEWKTLGELTGWEDFDVARFVGDEKKRAVAVTPTPLPPIRMPEGFGVVGEVPTAG